MKLAAYIRVSTEGQIDAFGKDVQREAILKWADLNGHLITAIFEEDGVSGTTDSGDRPALRQLIEKAERLPDHIEGVVAFDATRFARRVVVQETLLQVCWAAGLRTFTTTAGEMSPDEEDPTKILIRQVLAVLAEFDHRTTVRRLHSGRKAKSAQGGYIGGVTKYGETVVGAGKSSHLVTDEREAAVIAKIMEAHHDGLSFREIADRLNEASITTKMGKQWKATQVWRIVQREQCQT